MKRRIAGAMLLVLLIALLAVNVSAAENFVCPCCGKAYSACNWQPWTLTDGGTGNTLTADGHYYLTKNMSSVTTQIRIGNDTDMPKITLDLRGYTINSNVRAFGVYAGSTLSIVDSVGGGTVKGKQTSTSQVGGVIRVNKNATLNLYGGTVMDSSTKAHAAEGGAIATEDGNCTINIAGGKVIGNTFAPRGGAIYAYKNSTVNISAGSVTGSSANLGGAIYLNNATLNLTGGTIYGGSAVSDNAAEGADAAYGGAVFACNNSTVTVNGGTIDGGVANNGAAIGLMASQLNMQSGTVYGGTPSGYGSAIALLADTGHDPAVPCTVNISGGTIHGRADSNRAPITIFSNAHTLTMTGGEIIGAGKAGADGSGISGRGTVATITLSGGKVSGAANMSTARSGVVYSRGLVNITECDIQVTAGNGPAVYMYQSNSQLNVSGGALESLPGRVRLVEDPKVNGGSGAYEIVNGITDGIWYFKGVEAVRAISSKGFVRSYGGGILNMQGKTVAVDVNGRKMTFRNGTFYAFDSANDTYNPDKCGQVTVESTATPAAAYFTAPTGKTYVTVNDGTYTSFHRYALELPSVSLRTTNGKEGIYYNATLRADAQAMTQLKSCGVALTLDQLADNGWAAEMDDAVQYSSYATSSLSGTKVNKLQSTSLVKILHRSNENAVNHLNANTRVYARPYLQLADGTYLFGTVSDTCMKDVADVADTLWSTLTDAQKQGLLGMYERFFPVMDTWNMPNLQSAYTSGDPAIDELILDYRRDLAVEGMLAQMNILWTVDQQLTYSKVASSSGPDQDLANYKAKREEEGKSYNPLDDQIIILYPDRIYQGLPYTHAASGLDAFDVFATLDGNGVYNVKNAHTSLFSGGSTLGTAVNKETGERTGQYNVARLGSDCWDMVHWSWGQLTREVTASHTGQITPSFGLSYVGEDIIEAALRKSKYVTCDGYDCGAANSTMIDAICRKTSKGLYEYKNILETDADGNPIANHDIDGTRIIRMATRTQNSDGSYDHQVLYQTFAMLKPGDAMVRWRNSSGHGMMITEVNVVYTNGKIDGTKSTLGVLEQGSGHEERQSRLVSEFNSATTAKHSSHTTSNPNSNCLYCAGYTDTVIGGKHVWQTDVCGVQTRTFKEVAEADFIGVTCDALQKVSRPETARISITRDTEGFTGIFTGRVDGSYRIAYVSLELTDAKGKTHKSTCVGMQDGVSSYFSMSRFLSDNTCGIGNSSVLAGSLPLIQDSEGNIKANSNLATGQCGYRFVCKLNSGHMIVLREGTFQVEADGTIID